MLRLKDGAVNVFVSELYQTTSAVIVTDTHVIVADPCWLPREVEEIRLFVESVREKRRVVLLFTHSDFDHIIGSKAFPEALVVASGAFARSPAAEREGSLEQIRDFDDKNYIKREYEIAYPETDYAMDGDGTVLELGKTRLVCYQAPGHNADGMMTVVEPHGVLILGDYLSDVEFPFISHDSRSYEETLLKLDLILSRHEVRLFVPGHGSPTRDPAEMRSRQASDLRYIRELRRLASSGDEAALAALVADAPFLRNQRQYHEENVKKIRQELAESGA